MHCDHGLQSIVTDLAGRIVNVVFNMLAVVRTLSTLYRCCKKNGLSKWTEINLDHEIVKHLSHDSAVA
jgi:hypothetical protein